MSKLIQMLIKSNEQDVLTVAKEASVVHWIDLTLLKKKTLHHPKADEEKRQLFVEQLAQYQKDNRPVVYLDESGFKAHDYRPYGYAKRGEKCFGEHNWHLKNQTNAIGAIYNNQLFAVGLYDCTVNSDVFHSWIEQLLLPELPTNSIIVMDNATFHKRLDTKEIIESAGHTILWLPPYSPDLNPIDYASIALVLRSGEAVLRFILAQGLD